MKKKVIYLTLFLVVVLISIIILKGNPKKTEQIQPILLFTPGPSTKIDTFKPISTNLSGESLDITAPITLTFSQPVKENLVLTLDPKTEAETGLGTNPNELIITPKNAWIFNTTYTLTISKSNLSKNNQLLDRDYIYTFKTRPFSGI